MAKSSKPAPAAPAPRQDITVHLDLPSELAAIAHAKNPAEQLWNLVGRATASAFAAGQRNGMETLLATVERDIAPAMWRGGFEQGRRSKTFTFELPPELSRALTKLADAPAQAAAPAPIINVSPTPVTIQNTVEVPSRPVLATPRADGSVLMVPQP
jgi:hypothetical protein